MKKIQYKSGYKYQLTVGAGVGDVDLPDCDLEYWVGIKDKYLTVTRGYAWDGATGGIDTENFMRASLFHDALCQMIEEGRLAKSYRKYADRLLYRICREDGMSRIRASWVYCAVRLYARRNA